MPLTGAKTGKRPLLTQASLARLLGVSQITISKALRGHPEVSDATRARVVATAQQYGYRINGAASAMRRGSPGCVALLMSVLPHLSVLPAALLRGMQEALVDPELHLMIATVPDEKLVNPGYVPRILREWHSEGLLINYNAEIPQQMIDLIDRARIPSVWINSKHLVDCVHPDDRGGAELAVSHLLAAGHRRIAYVDFTRGAHYSSADRQAGYTNAMREAGLNPNRIGSYDDVGAARVVQTLRNALAAKDRPTALLCYNDEYSTLALLAAAQAGLGVPKDLSVVAFGDEMGFKHEIKVSTMVAPLRAMGHTSVEMLLKKIQSPARPLAAVAMPFTFEAGQTVRPPAGD